MNGREAVHTLLLIGVAPLVANAQTERQVRRIRYLSLGIAQSNAAWLAAFHEGMVELRWGEGRDYVIDARSKNCPGIGRKKPLDLFLSFSAPCFHGFPTVRRPLPLFTKTTRQR